MVVQGRVARLVLRVGVLAVVDQGANLVRALGEVEFLSEKASNLFEAGLERVVAADVVAQDVLDDDECRTPGAVERIPIDVLPPNQRLDGLDVPAGAREVEGVAMEELAGAELLLRCSLARVDLGEDRVDLGVVAERRRVWCGEVEAVGEDSSDFTPVEKNGCFSISSHDCGRSSAPSEGATRAGRTR